MKQMKGVREYEKVFKWKEIDRANNGSNNGGHT